MNQLEPRILAMSHAGRASQESELGMKVVLIIKACQPVCSVDTRVYKYIVLECKSPIGCLFGIRFLILKST